MTSQICIHRQQSWTAGANLPLYVWSSCLGRTNGSIVWYLSLSEQCRAASFGWLMIHQYITAYRPCMSACHVCQCTSPLTRHCMKKLFCRFPTVSRPLSVIRVASCSYWKSDQQSFAHSVCVCWEALQQLLLLLKDCHMLQSVLGV